MNYEHDEDKARAAAQAANSGMFAMMAMMMICCIGVFILVALIPIIGWPAGIVVAVLGAAALMYAHTKLMRHGSHP